MRFREFLKTFRAADAQKNFRTDHLKANLGPDTIRGGLTTVVWHVIKFLVALLPPQ